ncbi:hypothetical protein AGMMS4957_22280 [Bacteroidia bacterium]|nr:hypothetical protein AGMMS4957_22280 [Bacteroidia bacterium]
MKHSVFAAVLLCVMLAGDAMAKPARGGTELAAVFFPVGSSDVRAGQMAGVAKAAAYLAAHPRAGLVLASSDDLPLAKKRSDAIVEVLTVEFGIAAERLCARYYARAVQPFSENGLDCVVLLVQPLKRKK